MIDIIKPENYLYTYFLADDEVMSRFDEELGCLIVGGAESSRFFGFFNDFYRALRALVMDPISSFQKEVVTGEEEVPMQQRGGEN